MDAIIFTSNTGHTERYARLLGKATGLPVYPLSDAGGRVSGGAEVIYLGWLMAGAIKGYKKAARQYRVRAVCAVGMDGSGKQTDETSRKNGVGDTPLFVLQGGFDINKLRGVYRLMMNTMTRSVGKALSKKPDKTVEEADMLDMMLNGRDCVSLENLAPVLSWWEKTAKQEETLR